MIDVSIHPRWYGNDKTFNVESCTVDTSHWVKMMVKNTSVAIFTSTRDQANRLADLLNEIAGKKMNEETPEQQEARSGKNHSRV